MREFGTRHPTNRYTVRPSAYAIVTHERDRIAIVRTPTGVFLPGGGIDGDETEEAAAAREVMEECGLRVRMTGLRCRAIQLVGGNSRSGPIEKHSTFFDAVVLSGGHTPVEHDHVLEWVSRKKARAILKHESHRWALGRNA